MTFTTLTHSRLPGIRSFVKRNDIFRKSSLSSKPETGELIETAKDQCRRGELRAGQPFPSPEELSKLSGASLVSSLEAVTTLLNEGLIRQHPTGQLLVAPPPVY